MWCGTVLGRAMTRFLRPDADRHVWSAESYYQIRSLISEIPTSRGTQNREKDIFHVIAFDMIE